VTWSDFLLEVLQHLCFQFFELFVDVLPLCVDAGITCAEMKILCEGLNISALSRVFGVRCSFI